MDEGAVGEGLGSATRNLLGKKLLNFILLNVPERPSPFHVQHGRVEFGRFLNDAALRARRSKGPRRLLPISVHPSSEARPPNDARIRRGFWSIWPGRCEKGLGILIFDVARGTNVHVVPPFWQQAPF